MSLARAWTRQLYEAWGVALMGPAAVIAALIVLALGGGFGGLGALGQLVSGPAVPAGSVLAGGGPGGAAGRHAASGVLPVVPAAALARPRLARPRTSAAGTSAPVRGHRARGSSTAAGAGKQHVIARGHAYGEPPPRLPSRPAPPKPTPAPTPTPTPAPTSTAPLPALVNQVLGGVESITSKIPGPLGQLGTGTLQGLGQTLDGILTPQS